MKPKGIKLELSHIKEPQMSNHESWKKVIDKWKKQVVT